MAGETGQTGRDVVAAVTRLCSGKKERCSKTISPNAIHRAPSRHVHHLLPLEAPLFRDYIDSEQVIPIGESSGTWMLHPNDYEC